MTAPQTEAPKSNGIACPRCGRSAWVVVATRSGPGRIVRVRACAGCEHQIRTREVFEAVHKPRIKPKPPAGTN